MSDKEVEDKIPDSFRIPLRALLWHNGIYKEIKQDEIIGSMFFLGYRKPSPELREEIKALHVQFEDKWDEELEGLPECSAKIGQAREVAEGIFYDQLLALIVPKEEEHE